MNTHPVRSAATPLKRGQNLNLNAFLPQYLYALPLYERIGVLNRADHFFNSRAKNRFGTRRGFAPMATRLQRHVQRGAPRRDFATGKKPPPPPPSPPPPPGGASGGAVVKGLRGGT